MPDPLFYILAPFLLGFGLFAVFLVVSIILKDPARPFRMFRAPPLNLGEDNSAECSVQGAEGENQGASTDAKAMADKGRGAEGAEETDAETRRRGDAEENENND